MLILIVLVAIPCALFGQRFRAAYLTSHLTRLASSDDVITVGDKKYFRWGIQPSDRGNELTFWEENWEWRDLIDADLQLLHYLKLEGQHIRDEDVTSIGHQRRISKIVLADTSVTDATIQKLQSCTRLEIISLYGSKRVLGDGFADNANLASLQVLELTHTGVVDRSLLHISKMPNLIRLDLGYTHVTDDGVVDLKGTGNLKSLWLNDTRVKGKCLVTLSLLPRLVGLNLSNTPLESGAFEQCSFFPALKHLGVAKTKLSDADLLRIAEVTDLETLSIQNTQFSSAAIKQFKELEPSCEINPK